MTTHRHRGATVVAALVGALMLVLGVGRTHATFTATTSTQATWSSSVATAPPPVSPSVLAGKALWLRAKDNTAASGTAVTTWLDQSGTTANTASAGTAPTVVTGATPSGGRALRFAGTGGYTAPLRVARYSTTHTSAVGTRVSAAAVDGSTATYWQSVTVPAIMTITPRQPHAETSITITSPNLYGPRDFTFEGSNNGTSWTTLLDESFISWSANVPKTFTFPNTTAFATYRLNVAETTSGQAHVSEMTLNTSPSAGSTEGELWIVAKSQSTTATQSSWDFGSTASINHYVSGSLIDSDFGSTTMRSFTPTLPVTSWRIHRVTTNGTTWAAYLDGTLQASYSSVPVVWPAAAGIGRDATTANYFVGDIAEVLVRDRVSTASEAASITSYLNSEHGLTSP